MHTPLALAICVSITTACLAEGPADATKMEWSTAYEAGLAAARSHSDEQARDLFERSWEISRTPGEQGLSAASLGQTYRSLGHTKEAKQWLERAREALGREVGNDGNDTRLTSKLTVTISRLADLYRTVDDYAGSERLLREALASSSDEAKSRAMLRNNLADLLREEGRSSEAQPLFQQSLDLGAISWQQREEVANAHSSLADLYRSENKLALAEDEWSRALQIDRTLLGETHPQVALLMAKLSEVYSSRREFSLAREYAMRASETMNCSFGENSMPAATALTNLAAVEQRAGNLDGAAKDYERAIRIARSYPEHRSLQIAIIRRYAELLKVMHRPGEAKALYVEAQSFHSK